MNKYVWMYDSRLRLATVGAAAIICARRKPGQVVAQVELIRWTGAGQKQVEGIFEQLRDGGYIARWTDKTPRASYVTTEKMYEVREI
jgi:hypothetical protein